MANTIKQKRGTTDPGASDLVVGELAINTTDGGVFTKTDGGTVVEVGSGGGGGASAINDLSDAVTYDSGLSIGLGTGALANDDGTDNNNTALGYNALNANTSGADHTAVGYNAGKFITTGRYNTLLGAQAGDAITTGQRNVILGYDAGSAQTTHNGNTLVGYLAGRNVNTDGNIAIGPSSLSNTSYTLARCVAIGDEAIIRGGEDNTAVGYRAGASGGINATRSTSLGNYAGYNNEGDDNVFIGYNSGYNLTSADDCTLLGSKAGDSITTGSNNIVIGYDADASSATVSNEVTLGNSSITKLRVPGLSVVAQAESFAIGGAIYENAQSISADYSITSGNNAMSAGPITIDSGVTVTVTSGCTWTVV